MLDSTSEPSYHTTNLEIRWLLHLSFESRLPSQEDIIVEIKAASSNEKRKILKNNT